MDKIQCKPILELSGINKDFYGNRVLIDVNLKAYPGEILAIIGQNGAGKSTLMKILAGIHPRGSYTGEVRLAGKVREFTSVRMAEESGVIMIPQEIEVFPNLTVAENLYFNKLGQSLIVNWNDLYSRAARDLEKFDIKNIQPRQNMGKLTRAEQQLILIVKALIQAQGKDAARVLILDEPTASLTESETRMLFEYLALVKERGILCLYISHRLAEVFQISDRVLVMRNGKVVGNYVAGEQDNEEIISNMIGGELKKTDLKPVSFGEELLAVEDLCVYDRVVQDRKLVDGVSLTVRAGEVLGVFGLLGAGKTETALAVYGAWQGNMTGEIRVNGKKVTFKNTLDAIRAGVNFLPEDRRSALFDSRSIKENISLIVLNRFCNNFKMLDLKQEEKFVLDFKDSLKLKANSLDDLPSSLSGGNKQKALVARILAPQSKLLIFDEPSVGVDIGTRMDLYEILKRTTRESGCGILVFSSDVDELLQVSDQIMVLQNGRQAAFFDQERVKSGEINQDMIIMAAIAS